MTTIILQAYATFPPTEFTALTRAVWGQRTSRPPAPRRDMAALQQYAKAWCLRLGARVDDRLVGWSIGYEDAPGSFFGISAGAHPEARRQGVYSALGREVIRQCRARGMHRLHSFHPVTGTEAMVAARLALGYVAVGEPKDGLQEMELKL